MTLGTGLKIAIGGKGGVGKTTVCAVWAQLFADDGFDVLAIDADPNTNLAMAFGLPPEHRAEPLIALEQLIRERTGTGPDTVGAYFKLNPQVGDLPEKYWVEVPSPDGGKAVKLLVLGAITQAGAGCACPEGAFLRAFLANTLLQRKEVVLVDLAAGVEFMGRASIQGIDALVVVVEPGTRSIETGNRIARMGKQLGVRCIAAIANKIVDAFQVGIIKSQLDIPVLIDVPCDQAVQRADLNNVGVFQACAELVNRLRTAKSGLERLVAV